MKLNIEKLNSKEIAYIATFGALWGASEIILGTLLHTFRLPFTGLLLTLIGIIIAFTCLKLTNKKRCIIYTGVIASILKILSFTTIKFGAVIGIMTSAVIGQIIIFFMGITLTSYLIAGGLMATWPFLQLLLNQLIIYSPKIFDIYGNLLDKIGIKYINLEIVILFILLLHFFLGVLSGFIAWKLSKELLKKDCNNETGL